MDIRSRVRIQVDVPRKSGWQVIGDDTIGISSR